MNASSDILKSTSSPVPCPRCTKVFRLPEGFSETGKLACPHCREEVSGREIAESLVPVAEIVQDSASGNEPTLTSNARRHAIDEQDFVIPKPLKTAMRRRERSGHPQRRSSKRKPARPERSAKGEILRIALGGLLALPIAQLILWWGFQADPAGLAPVASRYAPFVLPGKMRPAEESEPDLEKRNRDMPENQILNDQNIPYNLSSGG